jgi:hypothetical protein
MNNRRREINLPALQIDSSNFKQQCENDFRRIILSFLKVLKNPQSGGVGSGIPGLNLIF